MTVPMVWSAFFYRPVFPESGGSCPRENGLVQVFLPENGRNGPQLPVT